MAVIPAEWSVRRALATFKHVVLYRYWTRKTVPRTKAMASGTLSMTNHFCQNLISGFKPAQVRDTGHEGV